MRNRLTRTRFRKNQRGAAIVEASLTLMLFLVILLSLVDFGLTFYLHQSFVHQARTGARYGAINPDPVAVKNVIVYGDPAGGTGAGINGLTPASVTVTRQGTPTTATDRIVVTVANYSFTWLTLGYAGQKTGKPITITIPVEY